jgi:hypothetical protein
VAQVSRWVHCQLAALVEDDTEFESTAGENNDVLDDDQTMSPENDVQISDRDDEVASDKAPAYPVIMTTKQMEAAVTLTHALTSASNGTLSTLLHNHLLTLFTDQLPEYKQVHSRTIVEAFLMSINLCHDSNICPTEMSPQACQKPNTCYFHYAGVS